MTTSDTRRVTLVAGGSGIVGHSVAMELKRQGWRVRALARRPITGIETITLDLTNRDAIAAARSGGSSAMRGLRSTAFISVPMLGRQPEKAIRRTCRPTSTSHSGRNLGRAHRRPVGTMLLSFLTSWWEISLAIR